MKPSPKPRRAVRSDGKDLAMAAVMKDVGHQLECTLPARVWEENKDGIRTWEYDPLGHNIIVHVNDRDKILAVFRWAKSRLRVRKAGRK